MKLPRRTLFAAAAAALPLPALAQARSIRLVVPFAAGGAADSAARTLAPRMAERLGATIVVENRTGAGGSIGGAEVARAAPDGATLLWDASSHIVNHALLRGLSFDYATAFTPISMATSFPQVVAVKADFPAQNLAAFIAAAKATGAANDPLIRQRIAKAEIGLQLMRYGAMRMLSNTDHSKIDGAALTYKIQWASWRRGLGELAMDIIGQAGEVAEGDAYEWSMLPNLFLYSRSDTIYGGTNQIQRNLIAERGLGMPREPRGDV